MLTSIVIVTYNKLDLTQQCIESIRDYTEPGTYEIVVVDNDSRDDTRRWLQEQPDLTVILNDANNGFPQGCNQGIDASRGDSILLLNNDTVVTTHWLSNMRTALYSAEDVGAVGTVTNNCSYFQTVPLAYSSMDQMQRLVRSYNVSNPDLWEERMKLVGYNMLIRRSALERTGPLDERFTPGNYEDDDLSHRLRLAGYRLLLCKDTFIHHYGSVSFGERAEAFRRLLATNRQKFTDKWGFDPDEASVIRYDLAPTLREFAVPGAKVLEVGCGAGGTLLYLRSICPEIEVYGVSTGEAARLTALIGPCFDGTAEEGLAHFAGQTFDVIILNRCLHRVNEPLTALRAAFDMLRPGGLLAATVPNLFQPATIYALLDNTIRREQLAGMSYLELHETVLEAGFAELAITGIFNQASETDHQFMRDVGIARGRSTPVNYNMAEFVVRAKRPEL